MRNPVPDVKPRKLEKDLKLACERALKSIVIAPRVRIQNISIKCVRSIRFDSFEEKLIFVVTITTNDASMVRGDSNAYKGSYKERIEGLLDFYAKRVAPNSEVHLEINGPNSRSVERLILIEDLTDTGLIQEDSPIVETARRFSIPEILIRGRHIIAPSPTIADYLGVLLRKETIRRAVDLFGGTGLTAKVLCTTSTLERAIVVERKHAHLKRMKRHLRDQRVELVHSNAFKYHFGPQDLIVADPYYEDAKKFLHARLDEVLKLTRIFVFVPGNVEDLRWNNEVEQRLINTGANVRKWTKFGQVLFDVRA